MRRPAPPSRPGVMRRSRPRRILSQDELSNDRRVEATLLAYLRIQSRYLDMGLTDHGRAQDAGFEVEGTGTPERK